MTKEKPKIEIMSKEKAFWNEIKESTHRDIERLEKLLKFQKAILDMVDDRIEFADI